VGEITSEGPVTGTLNPSDYGKGSDLKTSNAELNLVVGAATRSIQFVNDRQWNLLWRDADLLFQSPRPMSVYENT